MVVRDRRREVDCLIYKVSVMATRMFWNKIRVVAAPYYRDTNALELFTLKQVIL